MRYKVYGWDAFSRGRGLGHYRRDLCEVDIIEDEPMVVCALLLNRLKRDGVIDGELRLHGLDGGYDAGDCTAGNWQNEVYLVWHDEGAMPLLVACPDGYDLDADDTVEREDDLVLRVRK